MSPRLFCLSVLLLTGGLPELVRADQVIRFFDFENGGSDWQKSDDSTWECANPDDGSEHCGYCNGSVYSCDPTAAYSGNKCFGNNLLDYWCYPSYLSQDDLISPILDCSQFSNIRLKFYRWLTVEKSQYDQAIIWLSNDSGVTWNNIWENDYSGNTLDTAWTEVNLDISDLADAHQNVIIKFSLQTDEGLQMKGWNIDDLAIRGIRNPTATPSASPQPSSTPVPSNTSIHTQTPSPPPHSTSTHLPTMSPTPSFTITLTPTFSPTVPSGFPTNTALPPTHTPNIYSPTPEPSSCGNTRVELIMPDTQLDPNDICSVQINVVNCDSEILNGYPLFALLDISGSYFFAPSFSDFDYYLNIYEAGGTFVVTVLPEFPWPAFCTDGMSGLQWYAALTNPEITALYGDMDILEFSWTEQYCSPTPTPSGPAATPTNDPENPTSTPPPSHQWTIPATRWQWWDTGLYLENGNRYTISAWGEICFYDSTSTCLGGTAISNPFGWCNNEDVCTNAAYCELFNWECGPEPGKGFDSYTQFPHAALLVKQGNGSDSDPGRVFRASDGFPGGIATYSGPMYLLINDHKPEDNTGYFTCEVSQ